MTFIVGDPGHVAEHNNIAAQAATNTSQFNVLNTAVTARVAKGDLVVSVDDQAGATDDIKIDAAIAAAAASAATKVVWFAARQYTVNTDHTIASINDLDLVFAPGASLKIGASATGALLTGARIFTVSLCNRINIDGVRVDAPATPLLGAPVGELAIIQIERSSDCMVQNGVFNLTNTWDVTNTYLDSGVNYQFAPAAVWIKGPTATRNVVMDVVVTGGQGVMYAYNGSTRSRVERVTVISAPANAFTGIGNSGTWSEDNVLEDCTVLTCARMGVEDWSKIRRTVLRNVKVFSPGFMGMSLASTGARLISPYIEGSPTYVVVEGARVAVALTTSTGIIVDGNTSVALGETALGTLITGAEVRGGVIGISQTASATSAGQVAVVDSRLYNWGTKGIQLQDSTGGLPGLITGCYLENGLLTTTTRYGIQAGIGAHISDCDIRVLAAANGGTSLDIPMYLSSNDQHWSNIRVDGTGVTVPSVPVCYSGGATPSGVVVEGILLTGGVALSLQYLVNPTVRNIVASNITWGTGGAATSPVKVAVEGGTDVWAGTGSPESVVTAGIGSVYRRRDGSASTSLYVKESGAGNTGWIAYNTVRSVAARTGAVVLTSADVGLTNCDNTSDVNKPVSTAQATADGLRVLKAGDTMTGLLALATGLAGVGGVTVGGDVNLYRSAADILCTDDDLRLSTLGKGLRLAEGTNAKAGVATLVTGTKVVSTTAVTATSRIHLTCQSLGTVVAPSALCVSARTAGTSFTILASQATDTSVIYWSIIEPS